MNWDEFRGRIATQLKDLPLEASVAFSTRVTLRVALMFLREGGKSGRNYRSLDSRKNKLYKVFEICNLGLMIACGQKECTEILSVVNSDIDVLHVGSNSYELAAADSAFYTFSLFASGAFDVTVRLLWEAMQAAYAAAGPFRSQFACEIANDLEMLNSPFFSSMQFAAAPIWAGGLPKRLLEFTKFLSESTANLNLEFSYWHDFYIDRINGEPLDLNIMLQAATIPKAIRAQGLLQTNAYLLAMRAKLLVKPLNRVRAIFIGYGDAGKTSLVKVLNNVDVTEGSEPMTPGIAICEWPVPDSEIKAHFWDFGGQVMVHATHQLFLRESCLYVLVISARAEINATEQAEYWLEHVKSFGKDSPVIIVGNRADQTMLNLDMGLLKDKYPNIVNYYPLSCTRAQDEFKPQVQAFQREFCKQLKALTTHQMMFTKQQFSVLQSLRESTPKLAFLSREEFTDLCEQHDIDEAGVQNRTWLLDILDKLGVIIHFKQLSLADGYVLNPRWLTYGIYTLMYHQRAHLNQQEIVQLLSKEEVRDEEGNVLTYPPEKCRFIMEAMREFKLCYSLSEQKETLIIPSLLPSNQPSHNFEKTGALAFELKFAVFLPRHVMPELIVQRHREIGSNPVWQSGVVLDHPRHDARALLIADYHERRLRIWVSGPDARDYLHLLREDLANILSNIEIDYTELIILPQSARLNKMRRTFGADTGEAAPYTQIMAHAADNIPVYISPLGGKYDVATVLKRFFTPSQTVTEIRNFNQININADNGISIGDKIINITDSNTGDVIIANLIKDSFNKLEKTSAASDVKALLDQLLKQIETAQKAVLPEQQEAVTDMANDAQALVTETTRSVPRPDRLDISLNGIREAAQTVGEIGKNVLATEQLLRPLLGG